MFRKRNHRIERWNRASQPEPQNQKRYLVSDLELFNKMGIGSA